MVNSIPDPIRRSSSDIPSADSPGQNGKSKPLEPLVHDVASKSVHRHSLHVDHPLKAQVTHENPTRERLRDPALQQWLDDPTATGNKQEAVRRIELALQEESHTLVLSGLHLNQAPPLKSVVEQLTSLDLSNNRLTALQPEIKEFKKLEFLNLSDNQFSELPSDLTQVTSLKMLNLARNNLTTIPIGISDLYNLHELNLCENRLTQLPRDMMSQPFGGERGRTSPKLKFLKLTGNPDLLSIPSRLAKTIQVIGFSYAPGPIQTAEQLARKAQATPSVLLQSEPALQSWWDNPNVLGDKAKALQLMEETSKKKSRSLDLCGLGLSEVPPLGILAEHVQEVNLSYIALTYFPSQLYVLSKLSVVNLSHNQLSRLPPSIDRLANLQRLNLSHNQLTTMPPQVGSLSEVRTMNLSHNLLVDLPDELGSLVHLTTLTVSGNPTLDDVPWILGPSVKIIGLNR